MSVEVQQEKIPKEDVEKLLYDIFMVYSPWEWDVVYKLYVLFERFLRLDKSRKPSVCLDLNDLSVSDNPQNSRIDFLESAIRRSSCAFLFFSHSEVSLKENPPGMESATSEVDQEHVDGWKKYMGDSCLMATILRRQEIMIVPVKMLRDSKVPERYQLYRGIDVSRLLRGKNLIDVDVNNITMQDIDERILDNIARVLSAGRSQKRVREKPKEFRMAVTTRPVLVTPAAELETSLHEKLIQQNYSYLTENVDVNTGLFGQLLARKVLTLQQHESVGHEPTSFQAVESLLDILYKKPFCDFQVFLEALRATGQGHIADNIKLDKYKYQ